MSENSPFPSGVNVATCIANAILQGLDDRVSREKKDAASEKSASTIALLSAGIVDEVFCHAMSLGASVPFEVLVKLLAESLRPDAKAIRRMQSQLDVLIETPLRTAIGVFKDALKLTSSPDNRNLRLHDAQVQFDQALGATEGQRVRGLLPEQEWLKLDSGVRLLAGFCAAARKNALEEAKNHCAEVFRLLDDASKYYLDAGNSLKQEAFATQAEITRAARPFEERCEEALRILEREIEDMEKSKPSDETFSEAQARAMELKLTRTKDPTYHLSPEAGVGWYWQELGRLTEDREKLSPGLKTRENERLVGKILGEREPREKERLALKIGEAFRQAASCEARALQYRRMHNLIDHTLDDLARHQA